MSFEDFFRMKDQLEIRCRPDGIHSLEEAAILCMACVEQPIGLHELKARFFVSVSDSSLSRWVERLVQQGYLRRDLDPEDGHYRRLFILPRGEKAWKAFAEGLRWRT